MAEFEEPKAYYYDEAVYSRKKERDQPASLVNILNSITDGFIAICHSGQYEW